MSIAVLFNQLSGRRSERWNRQLIQRLSSELPEPVQAFKADNPNSLNAALTDILNSDAHSLMVAGGDGTLNRIVNALIHHPQKRTLNLALIPNGTGNSFALDLGIRTQEDTLQALKQNNLVQVDIGVLKTKQQTRYFINNFGIGLVYDITRLAAKLRPLGSLSYAIATLVKLIRLPALPVQLTIDGQKQNTRVLFLDICNSRFTGGDMNMAPDVTLTDRQFQMVWVPPISRLTLLRTFPKLYAGTHLTEDFVHHQMAQRIELSSTDVEVPCILDGDLTGSLPLQIEMSDQTLPFYTLRH